MFNQSERCLWRELSLMCSYLVQAILPVVDFSSILKDWRIISHLLKEPVRKRKRQLQFFNLS